MDTNNIQRAFEKNPTKEMWDKIRYLPVNARGTTLEEACLRVRGSFLVGQRHTRDDRVPTPFLVKVAISEHDS